MDILNKQIFNLTSKHFSKVDFTKESESDSENNSNIYDNLSSDSDNNFDSENNSGLETEEIIL